MTSGLVRGGHVARITGGYVVEAPADARDFYVSGTGYLCCRSPVRMVLTEAPVTGLDVDLRQQPRSAALTEREAAGLTVEDAKLGAVFLATAGSVGCGISVMTVYYFTSRNSFAN